MPAPSVRPLNPDHQRLIEALLTDPSKVMCPICGERGFWDNREGKKNPKSPDYKCKNKACVGATPMKGKNPYAVWIPEGFADTPATPSKRVPSPYSPAPTSQDPDAPLAGENPVEESLDPADRIIQQREAIETAYRWALNVAYAAQQDLTGIQNPPSGDMMRAVQAGAATLLIQASQRGAI